MTTVAAKPAPPGQGGAAPADRARRAGDNVRIGRLHLRLANWEPGHDG
jgi:hypothetical protein